MTAAVTGSASASEPLQGGSSSSAHHAGATARWTSTSYELATLYSKSGKVLATKRYGPQTEGKVLHPLRDLRAMKGSGTGGTSSASGCVKVEIYQTRKNIVGSLQAQLGVWTHWCWTRSTQVVSVDTKGKDLDVGAGYSIDSVVDSDAYYYDFSADDGHPKSAYHWHVKEGFTSPSAVGLPAGHWYPKNTLDSYYNGTNQWFTSD